MIRITATTESTSCNKTHINPIILSFFISNKPLSLPKAFYSPRRIALIFPITSSLDSSDIIATSILPALDIE